MENRAERKLEWNGKSEARKMEQKGKNLRNGKGSGGWKKMETQKEEIWDITSTANQIFGFG